MRGWIGDGYIQPMVLDSVFLMVRLITSMIGLVADLFSFNRQLVEMVHEGIRRIELRDTGGNSAQD